MLFWKIIPQLEEIEVVMRTKGTSYAAVGWRPHDITQSCKSFPIVQSRNTSMGLETTARHAVHDSSKQNILHSSKEKHAFNALAEPTSEAEPKPKAEPEPEPKAEPLPTAEGKAEPETVVKVKAEPEPDAESEPVLEPKAESKAEPEPKAESKAEPEPKAESKAEPEPKAESKAEPEPEIAGKAEPEPEGERIAEPEPKVKNEPEQRAEAEPQPHGEPGIEKKVILKPKDGALSELEPEPEPEPQSHYKHPVDAKAEPEAVVEPSSKTESTREHGTLSLLHSADPILNLRLRREIITSDFIIPATKPEPGTATPIHLSTIPVSQSEPKAEIEPEPSHASTKSKNIAKHNSYPERTPFTPRADFHAMDCTDIVIGMARGSLSRIQDYYTRDRSTPRVDSYFGGKDDITAALGYEVDGVTTVLFRKKLKAMDLTDHAITNSLMDVIWARGQEPNMYVHFPSTGLEAGKAKVMDFYRPDELKYHGHRNQRGKLTINFYAEEKIAATEQSDCQGGWEYPANCEGKNCEYSIKWKFLDTTDEISFTITTKWTDRWTGVGFSKDQAMPKTDAIIGWIDHLGRATIFDVWMSDYAPPKLDISQDIYNISGESKDGMTTLRFVRKRLNIDFDNDVHFSDTDCPYLMFPVNGGTFNAVSKNIAKHLKAPVVSSERICIRRCPIKGLVHEQIGKPEPESEPEPVHDIKPVPELTAEPEPEPKDESILHVVSEPEPKTSGGGDYISSCLGEWKSPPNCEGHNCEYKANWFYLDETDEIIFTISSKSYNKWTGIGFSRNQRMAETDAVIGWIEENGRSFIMDTWLKDYSPPILDSFQNIHNASGQRVDGMTVLQFVRKRNTKDSEKDLQFTDQCLYFIFPIHGGVFNSVNKKIRKHESTPVVSDRKICIQSCNSKGLLTTITTTTTTTTTMTVMQPTTERKQTTYSETLPSSQQVTTSSSSSVRTSLLIPTVQPPVHFSSSKYAVQIKLRQIEKSELKNEKSQWYLPLQKQLMEELKTALQTLGPQNLEFAGFESGESGRDVIAKMHVTLPDKIPMKEGRQLNTDKSNYKSDDLHSILNATVNTGRLGNLPVDPAYLKIVSLSAAQDKLPAETAIEQESSSNNLSDEQVKVYIIISGVLALVFLVIVQAACMIYRDRRAKKGSHTKSADLTASPSGQSIYIQEKLLNNSHWRDYSVTASSNYSYENFAMQDDENKISKHPIGSVLNGSGKGSTTSQPTNGLGLPRVGPPDRMLPRNTGYSATFERMAMRRNNGPSGTSVPPSYATHDRSLRSMTGSAQSQQELRPDFYFMPHQRRYSGEVVRVFVDYNNPEYTGK